MTRGSTSGPTPSSDERGPTSVRRGSPRASAHRGSSRCRSRSWRCSSSTRCRRSSVGGSRRAGRWTSARSATSSPTRAARRGVVHGVAGDGVDRTHRCSSRSPARTCSRGTSSRAAALVRGVGPVPFVLPTVVVGSAFLALLGDGGPLGPRPRPDARRHPARARVLQLRGGGAHGRRPVVAPRPAARRKRHACSARAGWRTFRDGHAAGAAAGDRGRSGDRVPLHLHVVRRDPHPRRPAATRRSRPRSTARPCSSSTCRKRPRCRSCNWSRSCVLLLLDRLAGRGASRCALRAQRETARRARTAGERTVRRRRPRPDGRAARRADRRPRPALVRHRRRLRARLLPGGREARRAARSSCLRSKPCATRSCFAVDRDRDRPRDRRAARRSRSPGRRADRHAGSTRCSSCRSGCRP